jgi:mono/diheme cytochrome c family protein
VSKWRWWLVVVALLLAACGRQTAAQSTTGTPYPTLDAAQVERGRALHLQHCASCHGANAEGAPTWPTPAADGLEPAPPHDDRGHTWHHPDRVLYEVIHHGMSDPLKPGSPLRMPAFGDKLSDADIHALIEYFKSLWSAENRQWQWEETRKHAASTPMSP